MVMVGLLRFVLWQRKVLKTQFVGQIGVIYLASMKGRMWQNPGYAYGGPCWTIFRAERQKLKGDVLYGEPRGVDKDHRQMGELASVACRVG